MAPGTWASGLVCGIFLAIAMASEAGVVCIGIIMLAIAAITSVACLALGRFAQQSFARPDPGQCTLDEWAGQALTLAFLPILPAIGQWPGCLATAAVAFVSFRLFDILKPPPVRQLERFPAGLGILLDDLAAGIYANIASQIILRCIGSW